MPFKPTASTRLRIGLALSFLLIVAYGSALTLSACLFIHERYGIWVPISLLALVVGFAAVDAERNLARAASVTLGYAVGLLVAGAFFWVRYAFYTHSRLTIPLLAIATVTTHLLLAIAWNVDGRRRGLTAWVLAYTLAAITLGQGVPDRDPMRPNALAAARRLDQLAADLQRRVAAAGTPPSSLDEVTQATSLVGYGVTYEAPGGGLAPMFRLFANPDQYGVTGCHAFYSDSTGLFTYTRQPRPATADDLSWR